MKNIIFRIMIIKTCILIFFATIYLPENIESDGPFSANRRKPYHYFGARTSYEFIYPTGNMKIPQCEPIMLWILNRHGTRYPSAERIDEIKGLFNIRDEIIRNHEENKKGELGYGELMNLKNWRFNLTRDLSDELTEGGKDEMRMRGYRISQQYPKLFYESIKLGTIQIRTSMKTRSIDSATAFAEGLVLSDSRIQLPRITRNDTLLNNERCTKWEESLKNPALKNEFNQFKSSTTVVNMINTISTRLGFERKLTFYDVKNMYNSCRFEKAWAIKRSPPFCAVFSNKDLKILEFLDDLNYYYKNGYGNDLFLKIACPLVKDIIENLRGAVKYENGNAIPSITINFSQTNSFLPLVAALGIRKDEDLLTHHSFEKMDTNKWRTSFINPFGANLEAVLYRCKPDNKLKIIFRLNEYIVRYPGCRFGLCSWEYIEDKFKSYIDSASCNLDFCEAADSTISRAFKQIFRLLQPIKEQFIKISRLLHSIFTGNKEHSN